MNESNSGFDSLAEDLAGRFRALGRLFDQLGSQEATQKLLDSLISEDAATFNKLIEPVDIPNIPELGKCFWVREIIDRAVVTPTLVEVCVLRDDLTPAERGLYLSIAIRHAHGPLIHLTEAELVLTMFGDDQGIPPGPFLEELKANGLVTCDLRVKYEVSTVLALGRPEKVCV